MDILEEIEKYIKIVEEEFFLVYFLLENGKFRDFISRVYYLMFYVVKVLFFLKGINLWKYFGVIRMFGFYFVDSGFIERFYVKYFICVFLFRLKVDYDVYYELIYEEVENVVEIVECFLERIKSVLEEIKNG